MDITVSSPGSPGTSFTDNVKDQIVLLFNELKNNDNFNSLADFKEHLKDCGLNPNYTRNILPFLQYCGIIKYENLSTFENKKVFTNIGHVYVDILESINIAKQEPEGSEQKEILELLEQVQETVYFQCLVIMMKTLDCNYATDFYDVLRFVYKYGFIDSTEYLLIQYEREQNFEDYIESMADTVQQYRNGTISINVKTKTKNADDGEPKSVNSFPYVNGNFTKAGVFYKSDGKFYITEERRSEVECAIREVGLLWQNSVE